MRGNKEIDYGQYDSYTEIFSGSGAAVIYKKSIFETVGLFEEDFHSFFEDVDLGFRAQIAGFKCKYVPKAVVYHYGGSTLKGSKFKQFLIHRNYILLLVKTVPFVLLIKNFFNIIIWQIKLIYFSILHHYFITHLKSLISAVILSPKMIKKRLKIHNKIRKVSIKYIDLICKNGKKYLRR